MKMVFEFEALGFEKDRYTRALQKALKQELKIALYHWLKAVLDNLPVYTGRASRSLRRVAEFVDAHIETTPATGKRVKPSGWKEWPRDETPTFRYDAGKEALKPNIKFDPGLMHVRVNEEDSVNPPIHLKNPAPWHAFKKGREAYRSYLRENLRNNIPKITNFIIKTRIRS